MSKEMIVSVNGREKKIAILDNGRVTEFYIERGEENSGVAGNVYKGRVMRVLPGMQSAFVDVGLERDAFLYVSDFFDEDEEIERIVMEKAKKTSPEEAKREADEHIDRSRIEREKQMESVQEIAEPLRESSGESNDKFDRGRHFREPYDEAPILDQPAEPALSTEEAPPSEETRDDAVSEKGKRGRGRGKRDKDIEMPKEEAPEEPVFVIEYDNAGFERISDDSDTGEMFKDAFMQEAIIDRVRAIEFDMETIAEAEVGSLLAEVGTDAGGFERIADEDETPAPAKGRGRAKAKSADTEEKAAPKRKTPAKRGPAKGKFTKSSKTKKSKDDDLPDAEASHRESDGNAEMAVRRGGRGGRRRTTKKTEDGVDEASDTLAVSDIDDDLAVETAETSATNGGPSNDGVDRAPSSEVADEKDPSQELPHRGRDNRGNRESRESRENKESDGNRDTGNRETNAREGNNRDNRENRDPRGRRDNRGGRNDRPSGDRNDSKRFDRGDRGNRPPQPTISDLLKEGQEILVQIAKEPIAKKGARITSHIALPGRYLVYMPTIEHLGVSRKIESASERSRLRTLIQRIRQDAEIPSGGFIVRTAGIGISEEDLRNDAKYLARMWADARKNSEKKKSPTLVHQDLDLVQRILRDQLADNFTAIRVDNEEEYLRTVEFINLIQPRMVNRIKLYTRDEPILDYYGVQEEIDKALKPRVWLKSGGYLVINQTEALVAIDVNTGKFVGKGNARLEDTITRTNMEAVDEIARQIRLRDLGGIIVLDLIDMEDRRNRNKVSQALQEALSTDRSPTKVLSFNDFGLIIMTRKRVKQSLERTMCAPCDYCEGAGWVKSPTTVCYEILAEARRLSKNVEDVRRTTLRVHPDVATALRNSEREVMDEIEAYLGNIDISSDKSVHQAQFDFAFI